MKITTPRTQVHIRVLLRVLARLATHSPKAAAPPPLSIRAMMLPIRPQTMNSHWVSPSVRTLVRVSLSGEKKADLSAITKPSRAARVRPSRIRLV